MGQKYEVKKDCFGYKELPGTKRGGTCTVLKKLYCKEEKCGFYKPKQEDCNVGN